VTNSKSLSLSLFSVLCCDLALWNSLNTCLWFCSGLSDTLHCKL
jgi:hypothetical protein